MESGTPATHHQAAVGRKTGKPTLRTVFVLLRCMRPRHRNCLDIRNLLFANRSVLQAYTTRTTWDGVEYCVAGHAVMSSDKMDNFRCRLQNMRTRRYRGGKSYGISMVKLLVSEDRRMHHRRRRR